MDRRIGILMLILIAMPIALAGDWPQIGQNAVNTNNAGNSLGDSILYNAFNLTQTGGGYFPVSGTFNGDISLVVYDSGIIKLYSSNYSLISSVDGKSIVSTLFIFQGITPYYNKIIGFNSTDIFVWNTDSSAHIYEGGSASLPIPPAVLSGGTGNIYEMFPRPSMNCYGKQDIGYCVFQSNLTNIVGFSFNYTQDYPAVNVWNVSRAETQGTLKPALYPTSGLDNYAAFYCTQGGRYGVMLINMTTGSLVRENCTTAVDVPWGMPLVYNQDIIWNGNPASATEYLHRVNTLLKEVNGFPVTYGSAGQNAPWGLSLIGSSVYACMLNSANVNAIHKYNVDSVPPTHSVIGTWGVANILNFPPGIGNSAGGDYFSCMNVIYNIGTGGNQTINAGFPSLYGFYDGVDYIANSFTDGILRVYRAQAAPLSYPNITLAFRNNVSNVTLGALDAFVISPSGNPEYFFSVNQDGTIELGQLISVGVHNITASVSGFYPINQQINVTAGTKTFYIYGQPNASINSSINLILFDSQTGIQLSSPINASVTQINSTGQQALIGTFLESDGNFTFIVPNGNYSIFLSDPSLAYQSAVIPPFIHAGTDNIEKDMTKVPFLSQSSPRVFSLQPFIYIDVNTDGEFTTSTKNYNFGNQLCINQTMWVNVTTIKADAEAYGILDRCGNEPANYTNPLAIFDPFIPYKYISSFFVCQYDTPGTYTIQAFAQSASFPNNYSNFAALLSNGMAQQFDVVVSNVTCDTFHGTIQQNVTTGKGTTPQGQFNLMLGVIIWIIASLAIGAFISALISGGPMVFGIAAGIVGIGTSIILALPFIGWLPPYFTLILTIFDVAAIAISVRMGMTG